MCTSERHTKPDPGIQVLHAGNLQNPGLGGLWVVRIHLHLTCNRCQKGHTIKLLGQNLAAKTLPICKHKRRFRAGPHAVIVYRLPLIVCEPLHGIMTNLTKKLQSGIQPTHNVVQVQLNAL